MYYPCSENKDADQLCDNREADLRLCFRICKNPVFSRRGSYGATDSLTQFNLSYGYLQVVSSTNGDVNPDDMRPGREGSKEPITAQQEVEVVDETK